MRRAVINRKAEAQLRTSPAVTAMIQNTARAWANACGGVEAGYDALQDTGRYSRARSVVIAFTEQARADNADHNTILKNIPRQVTR